jgi:hypothetical protein
LDRFEKHATIDRIVDFIPPIDGRTIFAVSNRYETAFLNTLGDEGLRDRTRALFGEVYVVLRITVAGRVTFEFEAVGLRVVLQVGGRVGWRRRRLGGVGR